MKSLRNEKKERRERREMRRERLIYKFLLGEKTKRRNRMMLKAEFIVKIDNNRRYEGKDYY
jgi:hypothetical protein